MEDQRLAVIIASAGRPAVLHRTLLSVLAQRRLPAQVILSVPGDEHVLAETRALPSVTVLLSEKGASRQRNRGIEALAPAIEIVSFLDDDVELHQDYLERIAATLHDQRDIVLADGRVLLDGSIVGEVPRDRAEAIVAEPAPDRNDVSEIGPEHAYGCNMNVRRAVFETVRFDERLPLYSYMEDRDFAYQCARLGRLVRCEGARLVHLASLSGRVSGRRFGYSQVINPLYLYRKGNYRSRGDVMRQVLKPVLVNAALSLAPNQKLDRRGRLYGNCRALAAALRGRIEPEDMLRL